MSVNANQRRWPRIRPIRSVHWIAVLLCVSQSAIVTYGESAEDHYRRGVRLFRQRDPEGAAKQIEQSLTLNPNQPQALKLLGLCYQLTEETEKAENAFIRASQAAPKDGEAWFFLGRHYYVRNFFDKALEALHAAVKFAPRDQRIHTYLGLVLEAVGRTEDALRAYREAIKCNEALARPDFRPHYHYGVFLSKLNQMAESERQLARAKAIAPENWETRFELAKLHYRQERLADALRELKAAVALRTLKPEDSARLYHLLARVYFKMGLDHEAQKAVAMWEKFTQ